MSTASDGDDDHKRDDDDDDDAPAMVPFLVAATDAARTKGAMTLHTMQRRDWPTKGDWHVVWAAERRPQGVAHALRVPDEIVAYWRALLPARCGGGASENRFLHSVEEWARTFESREYRRHRFASAAASTSPSGDAIVDAACAPLSAVEQERVRAAFRAAPDDVVVKIDAATEVSGEDVATLRNAAWVNDEVINAYLRVLQTRCGAHCHVFNTFFYSKLANNDGLGYDYGAVRRWTSHVDVFAKRALIVPVHLSNHWALAVVNLHRKRFEYYDSLDRGGDRRGVLWRLRKWLRDEYVNKRGGGDDDDDVLDFSRWTTYEPRDTVPHQTNSYDCGVFVMQYAKHVVEAVVAGGGHAQVRFPFTQRDMPCLRHRILLELLDASSPTAGSRRAIASRTGTAAAAADAAADAAANAVAYYHSSASMTATTASSAAEQAKATADESRGSSNVATAAQPATPFASGWRTSAAMGAAGVAASRFERRRPEKRARRSTESLPTAAVDVGHNIEWQQSKRQREWHGERRERAQMPLRNPPPDALAAIGAVPPRIIRGAGLVDDDDDDDNDDALSMVAAEPTAQAGASQWLRTSRREWMARRAAAAAAATATPRD